MPAAPQPEHGDGDSRDRSPRLRILFATPSYWPAISFGGPIWVTRALAECLSRRGHDVSVLTTSLVDLAEAPARRTRTRVVDGVAVHYLGTPARFRWMGLTPSLPLWLRRAPRPHLAHVFGYRDFVSTAVAAWCRLAGVPYVFEPLGMYRPKLRKIALKRAFDATITRGVARGAALVVATSQLERNELLESGVADGKVAVRPNGFPPPQPERPRPGKLRRRIGLGAETPLALYVGRIGRGKGLELLLEAVRDLPALHVAIVGPDGRDGTLDELERRRDEPELRGRIHMFPPFGTAPPLTLYADADVFVLPSSGENFGNVAAEAAACGTPVVVTDRCGVADYLRDAALVVPYAAPEIARALRRLLADATLRRRLGDGGRRVAEQLSWANVCAAQEALYERLLEGTARNGSRARAASR